MSRRINEGWSHRPLEDCVGALLDYRGKSPRKSTHGVPLITAKVIKNGRIEAPDEFIPVEDYDSWMIRGLPQPGDVVMTTEAPLGEVAQIGDSRVALAQRVITLRGKEGHLHNCFLKYLLMSAPMQEQLRARASGTTVLGIKQSELRQVVLYLPPFAQQAAIASILGALDDKIEVNRRMNETLEEMARALFKSWFVDFDPVHAKAAGKKPHGMDDATAALFPNHFQRGGIPEGWAQRTVDQIQDSPRGTAAGPFGSNLTRKHYVSAGVPVTRGENMSGSEPWLNETSFVFVSDEKAKELTGNSANPGDIVFTQRGTLGQVAIIPHSSAHSHYVLSQSQMRLRAALPASFLYFHFSRAETIENILANSTASGVPHINLGFLRKMKVAPYSQPVVDAFDQYTSPWMHQHLLNHRKALTLIRIRDTLLPKLLSGELRIPDTEKIVGDNL